ETGLYYLRNRYYDPATGVFTTPDPLEDFTGERYSYAGNDPVNQTDPNGLLCGNPGPFGTSRSSNPACRTSTGYRANCSVTECPPPTLGSDASGLIATQHSPEVNTPASYQPCLGSGP